MIFNLLFGIWCESCKKYIDPCEVYLSVFYEGSISCEHDHIIGNEWDLQWRNFIGEEDNE